MALNPGEKPLSLFIIVELQHAEGEQAEPHTLEDLGTIDQKDFGFSVTVHVCTDTQYQYTKLRQAQYLEK